MPSSASSFPFLCGGFVVVMFAWWSAVPARAEPRVHGHIRTSDPFVRELLARGSASSPTFRQLVAAIEASNVIVYVQRRFMGDRRFEGAIRFIGAGGSVRYLHIVLESTLIGERAVALMGHELQHAVEVVRAPWVVDRHGFAALYRSIGHACDAGGDRYDTADAVLAGRRVWQELANSDSR